MGLLLGTLCVALPAPSSVFAAEDVKELSKARAKFQRATELEQAGNWNGALELFREVGQVKMTPQVRFHIALCEENLGKLVAALGGYELAVAEADEVGPEFKQEVVDKIEDLKGRIPKLVIERGAGAQAAAIELDGVALGSNYIGVEFPVDTGPHTIDAKAPGHQPFSTTVNVSEKEKKIVEVVLEPAAGGAEEDEPERASSAGSAVIDSSSNKPSSKLVPLLVAGAGGVFLGASGVFFYLRQSKLDEAEEVCGAEAPSCPNQQTDGRALSKADSLTNEANTYNTFMWSSLVAGVVGVGVGVTLYVTSQPGTEKVSSKPAWHLVPGAPRANAGLSVIHTF